MGKFLESERDKQAKFKASSSYFSDLARSPGVYKRKERDFCLPVECTEQNLAPLIRSAALTHFDEHGIQWHDGQNGKPSNHLCDSQVCCVNFLFPFADQPAVLAQVLRPIFPEVQKILPVESGKHVSFEWIGQENYLCEKIRGQRTRGANCTSADAIVMFERKDLKRQIVLIEWKYTESYGGTSLKISERSAARTDRTQIYKCLYDRDDCPIRKELLPDSDFDVLFYEPFYQFMRQQFLANEMEKAHELGADIVSVLHIAPAHNGDFRKVTSPKLGTLGTTATSVWKKLVKTNGRFLSVSTEQLFGKLSAERFPEIKTWIKYITARYAWIRDSTQEI